MPESRDRTNEGWPAANLRDLASKSQTITDGETLDGIWASEAFGQTTKSPSNRRTVIAQLLNSQPRSLSCPHSPPLR